MEKYLNEKKSIIQAGKDMISNDWTVGTWGNISVRSNDGENVIITPSGVDYNVITTEMMSVADMNGNLISGKKPSIELELHTKIYLNRPDVNAIVHVHSPYTCAFACTRTNIPPVFDEMAQIIGGEVKTAKYAIPGTSELADNCVDALGDKMATLLANHGGVAVGKTLEEALKVTEVLEKSLQSYAIAKSFGTPVVLDDEAVNMMRDFFLNKYGK